MIEKVVQDSEDTVDAGIAATSAALDAALKKNPPDTATIMALTGLRSRYVFDRMQLTRAEVIAIDNSPPMQQAANELDSAQQSLSEIQKNAAASTQWINSASAGLDTVMDALNKLKTLAG